MFFACESEHHELHKKRKSLKDTRSTPSHGRRLGEKGRGGEGGPGPGDDYGANGLGCPKSAAKPGRPVTTSPAR